MAEYSSSLGPWLPVYKICEYDIGPRCSWSFYPQTRVPLVCKRPQSRARGTGLTDATRTHTVRETIGTTYVTEEGSESTL